jgi:hypothetical protein
MILRDLVPEKKSTKTKKDPKRISESPKNDPPEFFILMEGSFGNRFCKLRLKLKEISKNYILKKF